jgi:hypothetical protein
MDAPESRTAMAWSWEFMLQVFRSLGGKVDNIAAQPVARGVRLAPIKSDEPVRLYAPENLIVPAIDVEFANDRLKIKEGAATGKAERTFFENYQDSFGWTTSGRAEAESFFAALDELPADVREVLSTSFGAGPLFERDDGSAQRWYLANRMFEWRGRAVLAPLLELVRHDPAANTYGEVDGLFIAGQFADEIRVLKSKLGPFGSFMRFGVANAERQAFSVPSAFRTEEGCEISIEQRINFNSMLGSVPVPEYRQDGQSLGFSCLMIGNSRTPRLSRAIFYRVMRDAGQKDPERVFDRILLENRLKFLKLLEILEEHEGGLIPTLRRVVRYQLEAMCWCVGSREL